MHERLFDVLQGEQVDIVDYAVDCQRKTGRPPKLAVNANSWWGTNMTAATAQIVRDRAVGVHINPIERNILFYTLRILQLGIQLHFVFDGPKLLCNGGKSYPGHDPPSKLFRETLTNMGIPWHEAPAEAEAECAKMEIEGIVDGVWSEDGDAFAFGCRTLIRSCYKIVSSTERSEDTRKSFNDFKIYKLDDLEREYLGMDREGFILHAILNGSPAEVGELCDLEPLDVLDAAGRGLAKSLCAASVYVESLREWAATELATYMKKTNDFEIPPKFPKWQHVQDYLNPVTSTTEALSNLAQPQDPFLNEKQLFQFLVDKFQWTINQWAKFVLPVRIIRSLLATEEGTESQHDGLKLVCDTTKRKKTPKKTKATFLLCKATSLDTSALREKRGELETLPWILRKANCNQQRGIASYLITPDSNQKGKGVASSSFSGKQIPPLTYGARGEPPTPISGNGEGPSGTRTRDVDRSRRQSTPPSPTPRSRRRRIPRNSNVISSGIISTPHQNDQNSGAQTATSGKGKEREVLGSPPRLNNKRARSPEDVTGSSQETPANKRPRIAVEQPPSTPPARITDPADHIQPYITIDSDSEENTYASSSTAVEEPPSTPPARIIRAADTARDAMMIVSDDESDEYGSPPSLVEIPALIESVAEKDNAVDSAVDASSNGEYGSVPASPDLLALG